VRAEIDKRAMALLAAGHLAVDFSNGALPGLIPYFKEEFDLSYTLAALLMLASTASSSIVQPLFGLWSDRRGALWLLPGGVVLAGVGMGLAAAASSYWLVFVLVVASGLGGAAYHPEGSKFAAYVSGRRRATGMSAFSIGGNAGFALGPIAVGVLFGGLGARGFLLAIPSAIVGGALIVGYRYLGSFAPRRGRAARHAAAEDDPRALVTLLGVIAFRSFAWFGLVTFVPLWEVALGHSKPHANHLLALMLLAGGIGTILAGPAADRFGRWPVLLVCGIATPVLIAIYLLAGGVGGAVALVLAGPSVVATFGVTQVMGQEYLPRRLGLASGLVIGLSVGLGGIGTVLLGAVADAFNLRTAMWMTAVMGGVAVALTLRLPRRVARAREPELAPI
jgi:FSR family fosmidomycin resistance protein-like MFS transporter